MLKNPGIRKKSAIRINRSAAVGRKSILSVSLLQVRENDPFMTHFPRSLA
jgi:hypothetical protein